MIWHSARFVETVIWKDSNLATPYFEYQRSARRRSWILLGLFVSAITAIVLSGYFVVSLAWRLCASLNKATIFRDVELAKWNPQLFLIVSAFTLILILSGIFYHLYHFAAGGPAFARFFGARRIYPNTDVPVEHTLINIVEEISLACGIQAPLIYLLSQERCINAFTTGYRSVDAAIIVTQGALDHLTRDELQGVIAHEFSHLINLDTRLNIRLMAVVQGLILISSCGKAVLGIGPRNERHGTSIPQIVIGGSLLVIGSVGVFWARLIKSAICRQREFLADASAVQFTRNPSGLAGALKKIGGLAEGSIVLGVNVESISHFFFAPGLATVDWLLFACHPRIEDRIARLDPNFDGTFETVADKPVPTSATNQFAFENIPKPPAPTSEQLIALVCNPQHDNLLLAQSLISALPSSLRALSRDPYGARALLLGLLIIGPDRPMEDSFRQVLHNTDPIIEEKLRGSLPLLRTLSSEFKLPLVSMALPQLKQLTESEYTQFRECLNAIFPDSANVNLMDCLLEAMIVYRLDYHFNLRTREAARVRDIMFVIEPAAQLLLALSHFGSSKMERDNKALQAGLDVIGPGFEADKIESKDKPVAILRTTVAKLAETSSEIRRKLLFACITCIMNDKVVSIEELEALRIIGEIWDCPIPLLNVS